MLHSVMLTLWHNLDNFQYVKGILHYSNETICNMGVCRENIIHPSGKFVSFAQCGKQN